MEKYYHVTVELSCCDTAPEGLIIPVADLGADSDISQPFMVLVPDQTPASARAQVMRALANVFEYPHEKFRHVADVALTPCPDDGSFYVEGSFQTEALCRTGGYIFTRFWGSVSFERLEKPEEGMIA